MDHSELRHLAETISLFFAAMTQLEQRFGPWFAIPFVLFLWLFIPH